MTSTSTGSEKRVDLVLKGGGEKRRLGEGRSRKKNQKTLSGLNTIVSQVKSRYTWKQLNLPKAKLAMLNDIVAQVRKNNAKSLVLFTGQDSTNKKMAVECIAKDLSLDLYRIDLSMVVSKYIGETEKNLRRLFDAAESSNAILFFDEADALFGERSETKDSHDTYASKATNYLFQKIKTYKGLVILATKTKSPTIPPSMRRPQHIVEFPRPKKKPG
jgi:SpoVK/Ycf46/Vps4 family AAA+-type ATPase